MVDPSTPALLLSTRLDADSGGPGPQRIAPVQPHELPRGWPLHDAALARRLEALHAQGLPPHTLMRRAGRAVARLALAVAPHARRVVVLAGPGNNGGDGYEAALWLAERGLEVGVLALGDAARAPADARDAQDRARRAGIAIVTPAEAAAVAAALAALGPDDLVIDALFGRGLARAPSGAVADWIAALAAAPAPVLAVDLPSGLNGDSGHVPPGWPCVTARWTLALLSLAPGLFTGDGRDRAGSIWFDDLGTGAAAIEPVAELNAAHRALASRRHAAHKGRFGDVWICGGAPGMAGAAVLAARAAAAAGAGRVYLKTLESAPDGIHAWQPPQGVFEVGSRPGSARRSTASAADPLHPELMTTPLDLAAPGALEALAGLTVVAGCGGGQAIAAVLPALLSRAERLVLDADALNALAADAALGHLLAARARADRPTVLTPHPLEAARLLGCTAAEVQADRLGHAQALAARYGCVVVLKGSGSLVAAPGRRPVLNASGNAALATPGTGDVLAGWLGGSWAAASGDAPGGESAAAAMDRAAQVAGHSVWLHGAAAEAARPGAQALGANALIDAMSRRARSAPLAP